MFEARERVAIDHAQAAQYATAQQRMEFIIEEDHRQAALKATAIQRETEAAAMESGLHVDEYLRSINRFPLMEATERDHTLAAWKATALEREIEEKAAAMGMWPEQYLVYTKHPLRFLVA